MSLDIKSTKALDRVHPDLVRVVERASEIIAFRVTEGLRTKERQKQLVAQGKSRTMNSRHLTGHAVDLVDAAGSYDDAKMREIAQAMKSAADELGVPITWGGDWTKFCDTPHFELEWHAYPAGSMVSKIKAAVAGAAGTGGVAVMPGVPDAVTSTVGKVEEYTAIGGRVASLLKGVTALEPTALIGIAGLLIAVVFVILPNGGQHASAGD